jgi:signal transduction histidine kinase
MNTQPELADLLVVDDTPANLKLLTGLLREAGYKVRGAMSGKLALGAIEQLPPELILLDIKMPEMDGFELCERLKQVKEHRDIPIIFISALDDPKDKVHAFNAGGVDYITKPVEPAEVLARVNTHLELARSRRALAESERRLKESQQFARLGQWELDYVQNRLDWSDEVSRIFEIDQQQAGTSYEVFLNAIHPEDREAVNKAYTDSIANKTPFEIIHRLLMPDGRIKYVRELCFTEFDDDKPRASIGTVQDITSLKAKEEALQLANERLKELDRLKSMFIASMSHELRTPLNSIIGFSDLLLESIPGKINEQQRDNLERIQRAGSHLLELITDVIDISKIEAGRIDVFPKRISLERIITEVIDQFQPEIARKALELQVEYQVASKKWWPMIYTDSKRLRQCLLNLLSNAVKYTEQGSITILFRGGEEYVDIVVSDMGIGIAEQDMPKLFEAFERMPSHLKVKAGGSGLGLYLTEKIAVELLGGQVFVESLLGKGSSFTLRIPVSLPVREKQAVVEK